MNKTHKFSICPIESMSCIRRSSRGVLLAFVAALLGGPAETLAFVSWTPSASSSLSSASRIRTPQPVFMTKSSETAPRDLSYANSKRLSREEEQDLLRQVAELRRLQQLEKDLALQSPTKQTPLLSIRAKAAGYGTELEAYEEAMDRGYKARETLVTSNMGLVHYSVNDVCKKKKALNSLSREDLIQEGAIGLARAIDKFNPGMGTKFSTYAVYWIRAAILRCIAERDDIMRVPEHMSAAVRKVSAAAQRLGLELDGDKIVNSFQSDARWKEAQAAKALAEEAGLTDRQVEQALRVKQQRKNGGYVSYEAWMQNGQNMEVDLASTVDDSSSSWTNSLDNENLKSILSKFLRPKEMEALSWRYGLMSEQPKRQFRDYLGQAEGELFGEPSAPPTKGKWGEAMSFSEVGKQMSVSAEYGRRLCHKALKKLQQAAEEGQLEPALLF